MAGVNFGLIDLTICSSDDEPQKTFEKPESKKNRSKKLARNSQEGQTSTPPTLEELEKFLKERQTQDPSEWLSRKAQKRMEFLLQKGYSFKKALYWAQEAKSQKNQRRKSSESGRSPGRFTSLPHRKYSPPARSNRSSTNTEYITKSSSDPYCNQAKQLSRSAKWRLQKLLQKGVKFEEAVSLAKKPLNKLPELLENGRSERTTTPRTGSQSNVDKRRGRPSIPHSQSSSSAQKRDSQLNEKRFRRHEKEEDLRGANSGGRKRKADSLVNPTNGSNWIIIESPPRETKTRVRSSFWDRADRNSLPLTERRGHRGRRESQDNSFLNDASVDEPRGRTPENFMGSDSRDFSNGFESDLKNAHLNATTDLRGRFETWLPDESSQNYASPILNGITYAKPRTPTPPRIPNDMRSNYALNSYENGSTYSSNVNEERLRMLCSKGCSFEEAKRLLSLPIAFPIEEMPPPQMRSVQRPEEDQELPFLSGARDAAVPATFPSSHAFVPEVCETTGQSSSQLHSPVFSAYFPCKEDTPNDFILRAIKSENQSLPVEHWKVLKRSQLTAGAEILFEVDQQSMEYFKSFNRIVKFNDGVIQLVQQN